MFPVTILRHSKLQNTFFLLIHVFRCDCFHSFCHDLYLWQKEYVNVTNDLTVVNHVGNLVVMENDGALSEHVFCQASTYEQSCDYRQSCV